FIYSYDDSCVLYTFPTRRSSDLVLQHLLGDGEVGDDTVLHRADGGDVPGCASEHVLGFLTDRLDTFAHAPRLLANGYHRRFVEHDPFTASIDKRVRGAQVD